MIKILLLLVLPLSYVLAQIVNYEPWEPGEVAIKLLQEKQEENQFFVTSFLDYFVLNFISFYQNSLANNSVSRCPFEISCSRLATLAIKKYGILGYAIFIDRFFYRENLSAYSLYIKKEIKNGIIKLDDKIYLYPFH